MLLNNLLSQGPQSILLGSIVGLFIAFTLWQWVNQATLLTWLFTLLGVSIMRIGLISYWKKQLNSQNTQRTLFYYSLGALFGGLAWASLIFLYSDNLPLILQIVLLIVLFGMPSAALSMNANYMPTYLAFSVPLLLTLIFSSFFILPDSNLYFGGIALIYVFLVSISAYKFNTNLVENTKGHIINQQLMQQLQASNQELESLAYIDPLTELYNRRYFMESVENHLQHIKKTGQDTFFIMLIDLDKFKSVNDTYGHAAGDTYLSAIATRLKKHTRQESQNGDITVKPARLGGDEFVVMFHSKSPMEEEAITEQAKTLLKTLSEPIEFDSTSYRPSLSIGIAEKSQHGSAIKTLLKHADKAMYQAKQKGGNQYFLCLTLHQTSPKSESQTVQS